MNFSFHREQDENMCEHQKPLNWSKSKTLRKQFHIELCSFFLTNVAFHCGFYQMFSLNSYTPINSTRICLRNLFLINSKLYWSSFPQEKNVYYELTVLVHYSFDYITQGMTTID